MNSLSLVPHLAPKIALGAFLLSVHTSCPLDFHLRTRLADFGESKNYFLRHLKLMQGLGKLRKLGKMIYSDRFLTTILKRTKVIAVVGVSLNTIRPSYYVARYLSLKGYRVIPVNPGHAGKQLFGEKVHADLSEIDAPVDMVDIFRRSEAVPPIVNSALENLPHLRTVWMQIGVEHAEAAALAQSHGIDVIMNRCPKIEYQRLFGELRMAGISTGIISSKL